MGDCLIFKLRLWAYGAVLAVLASACSKKNEPSGPEAAVSGERRVFEVRGVVRELRPADREVVIDHEEIPDYMPAMTMPFEVKDLRELSGLASNDIVSFNMIVTEKDGWIEKVRKTGVSTNAPAVKERPRTRLVREVEPLGIGDAMPDYPFTNSLGEKIKLSDFKGQAYAFTFIFTRCPFPTFCPRMNMNFQEAYQQLRARQDGPTNWHLISISFDPDWDTPERLRSYSSMYHPDASKWSWVTGEMIEIDAITEQVGLAFAFENNTFNHNLRTVVVDRDGRVRKIFIGNEWQPGELVAEIIAGAEGRPIQKDP